MAVSSTDPTLRRRVLQSGAMRLPLGGVAMGLSGLTQYVAARRLGSDAFATYSLGYVLVVLMALVADVGTSSVIPSFVRLKRNDNSDAYGQAALRLWFRGSIGIGVLVSVIAMPVWRNYGYSAGSVVALVLAGAAMSGIQLLSAQREAELRVFAGLVPLIAVGFAGLGTVALWPTPTASPHTVTVIVAVASGAAGVVCAVAVGAIPNSACNALSKLRRLSEDEGQLFRASWPLWVVSFAAFLQMWLDKPIAERSLSPEELGVYAAIGLTLRIVRAAPQSLTSLLLSVYGHLAANRTAFVGLVRLDILLVAGYFGALAVVFAVAGEAVFTGLYGSSYDVNALSAAMIWSAVYLAVAPWLTQSTNWLNALGRYKLNMICALINGGTQTLGIIILAPRFGLIGVLAGMALGNCADAVLRMGFVTYQLGPTVFAQWIAVMSVAFGAAAAVLEYEVIGLVLCLPAVFLVRSAIRDYRLVSPVTSRSGAVS